MMTDGDSMRRNRCNRVSVLNIGAKISSPFSYAAHLTEIMLLGVVSLRAGKKIYYDPDNMRITNGSFGDARADGTPPPDANDLLTRKYRDGYSL